MLLKTWAKVPVPKHYETVTSLLLPKGSKNTWKGMKTVAELKRERGIRYQAAKDSIYRVRD